MKKIFTAMAILVFALTVGAAYAAEEATLMPGEISNYDYTFNGTSNGISVLDTGPDCSIAEGAGGLASESPGLELQNGVTSFDEGMSRFETRSSCEESVLSS